MPRRYYFLSSLFCSTFLPGNLKKNYLLYFFNSKISICSFMFSHISISHALFICDYISLYLTECNYNSHIVFFVCDNYNIGLPQSWTLWDLVTFFWFFICGVILDCILRRCEYYTVETLKSIIYSKECLYSLVSICLSRDSPRSRKKHTTRKY